MIITCISLYCANIISKNLNKHYKKYSEFGTIRSEIGLQIPIDKFNA